jgi:hypothetical protein
VDKHELARQEARAKRQREQAAAVAELGVMPAEATLFHVIQLGLTVPPDDLCRRATVVPEYSIGGQVSLEESKAALAGCFAKGWLRIVDDEVLSSLQNEIRSAGLLGPVYDYPCLEGVDFTHAGAEQWLRICDRLGRNESKNSFPYSDVVHVKLAKYFPSKAAALMGIERIKESECGVVAISQPHLIGPWRAQWWQRFNEGYRVDVELRMQWAGRSFDSYLSNISFDPTTRPIDVEHAENVLKRHGLPLVAWLVMANVSGEHDECSVAHLAAEDAKQLGQDLSERTCRAAVTACREMGWLRDGSEQVNAEIENLLRADDTIMPVLHVPKLYAIDFTVAGAELYRKLSAEILGPDWEDTIDVEEVFFLEVHHYCATEAAIAAANAEYAERGDVPISSRTVPIGPWCVHWWERFSSGYRLELTFGKQV